MSTPAARIARLPGTTESQLVAAKPVPAGQTVVNESPMVSIDIQSRYRYGDYCWDLVDRILADGDLYKQVRQGNFWETPQLHSPESHAVESELIRKHGKSRQLVRGLHALVATNNIGILAQQGFVSGYGLYALLSHADHSCEPSCTLEPGDAGSNALRLVAKRPLRAQEPITWSYFREAEFLLADVEERNRGLVDLYRFACRCARCQRERPPHLKGMKDLVAHYDVQLHAEALAMTSTPGGVEQALARAPVHLHWSEFDRHRRAG